MCVCVCVCVCVYIFSLFQSKMIKLLSYHCIMYYVMFVFGLPLTLKGACAVNKILFYSILCSSVSFFSPLITFSFGLNLSMAEYQIKMYY